MIIALIALTTAARVRTISDLDINYMSKFSDKYVFQIQQHLKTSGPGVYLPKVVLCKFDKNELCVFHTLNEYIDRTHNLRKSNRLFVSFKTFKAVTSCTLARWLKQVLLVFVFNRYFNIFCTFISWCIHPKNH